MLKKLLLPIAFAVMLFVPIDSLACACCADAGTYSISTVRPGAYDLDVLGEMKFGRAATLFMTEAEFESIKGLRSIENELTAEGWNGEFGLAATFAKRAWRFEIVTPSGKKGVMTLPMPTQMVKFKVDIHDGQTYGAGGPNLYKEFRFKGNVASGTGFFRDGFTAPATYFLVFQGRGNMCDNAGDYTDWRLEVNGRRAQFAFLGKMEQP